jgi:hypothetical protein
MIPIHFETDREALDAALSTIGLRPPAQARLVWLANTLELAEMEVAAPYWELARALPGAQILTEPRPLPLDENGMLPSVSAWGKTR